MKRTFFCLAFVISICNSAFLQDYHPLPESDTYWKSVYWSVPDFCPCMGTCFYDQLKTTGDTTIGTYTYTKLERSGIVLTDNCEEEYFNDGYKGAFRNDIENKKVYFVPVDEQDESLLYDFNLQIGDYIPPGIINPDGDPYFILDIDSVLVNNSMRKRYHIDWDYGLIDFPLQIIEGIGGHNLIAPLGSYWYFEEGYLFTCINIADSIIYPASCDLISSSNQIKKVKKIKLSPNPTKGIIKVFMEGLLIEKIKEIQLFDIHGRQHIISNFNLRDSEVYLDLSGYNNGIYFIRITTNTRVLESKIILQKN